MDSNLPSPPNKPTNQPTNQSLSRFPARTLQIYLAANPHLTDDVVGAGVAPRVGGAYFSDCRPKRTTREAEVGM
jgi:hypothetical protein